MAQVLKMGYGFLVSIPSPEGDHRFSFVEKEGANVYELGPYAGPLTEDPHKRWSLQTQAKLELMREGHAVVV